MHKIIIFSVILITSCSSMNVFKTSIHEFNTEKSINNLQRLFLSKEGRLPSNFEQNIANGKMPGEFDPNRIFEVLKHISIRSGYSLSYRYIYLDGFGGFPELLIEKSDMGAKNYLYKTEDAFHFFELMREDCSNILEYIESDGTSQGYFELILFKNIGSQFYLFWHAFYKTLIPIKNYYQVKRLAEQYLNVHSKSKYSPEVVINNDEVIVYFCTFSLYGGIVRNKTIINRKSPNIILSEEKEEMVLYYTNVML